jgi:hypothetical protein
VRTRVIHLIVSKISRVLFLLTGFKFVHKVDPFSAYLLIAFFALEFIANELYLYDLFIELENERGNEFDKLFKKTKSKDDDNV